MTEAFSPRRRGGSIEYGPGQIAPAAPEGVHLRAGFRDIRQIFSTEPDQLPNIFSQQESLRLRHGRKFY